MFAATSIVVLRRTAYMLALITLPFSVLSSANQPAYAGPEDGRFSDTEGHWAEKPILEAVSEGFISGYEDGTFQPDRTVSRAQFMIMLAESLQIPVAAASEDKSVLAAHLQSLRDIGIVDEKLFPADELDKELKRKDMIRLALAALDPEEVEQDDDKQREQAAAAGLIEGGEPQWADRAVTRAEAVVVLQRLQQAVHPEFPS